MSNTVMTRRRLLQLKRNLRPSRRDQARMSASFQKFDGMQPQEKVKWFVEFANRQNLRKLGRNERATLSYDLRALTQTVAVGFSWRRPLGPLSNRDLQKVHTALAMGLKAWRSSSTASSASAEALVANEDLGWRLPRHRERLVGMPALSDDPKERTATVVFYEAENEASTLVVAIAHFLLRQKSKDLPQTCACGCEEQFFPKRSDQRFVNESHGSVFRQRKWYDSHVRQKGK